MKSKKGKKYAEQNQQNQLKRSELTPTNRFKFNISMENLACFIGSKKNMRRNFTRRSQSIKKSKGSVHKQPIKPQSKEKLPKKQQKKQEADFISQSLNSILNQIEHNGLECRWRDSQELPKAGKQNKDYEADCDNNQIWSVTSVQNSSCLKSQTSTMDFYQPHPYYQSMNFMEMYHSEQKNQSQYSGANVYFVRVSQIGNDPRTTLMVRNIPNKYTIKDLSQEIDNRIPNSYDFLYLPCDIKNQCNVGYGFINFVHTDFLKEFYNVFFQYRWLKFRSQKICNLTYARLQGLNNLIQHFENSKVLNQKDKKYRPIIRQSSKIENLIKSQQLN